jgi:hypothetical protein
MRVVRTLQDSLLYPFRAQPLSVADHHLTMWHR